MDSKKEGLQGDNRLPDLKDNILQWAEEKGIFNSPCVKSQALKMAYEAGELCDAVAKQDKPAVIDGIGDAMVTLILLAEMHKLNLLDCLQAAYDEIKDRKGQMVDGVFVKDQAECANTNLPEGWIVNTGEQLVDDDTPVAVKFTGVTFDDAVRHYSAFPAKDLRWDTRSEGCNIDCYKVADPDAWVRWKGGDCPVNPDTVVTVRLENGEEMMRYACLLRWSKMKGADNDIAYFRVVLQD